MTSFVRNPYLGDTNPGTTEGLKLYSKAIKAPKTNLEINQNNAGDILTIFEKDANDLDEDQQSTQFRLIMPLLHPQKVFFNQLAKLILSASKS